MFLGQSALQRVERALRFRDRVHIHANRPQNKDVAEDVLENFDATLIALMGAMDVLARVAHRILSLGKSEFNAGWQKESWIKTVGKSSPDLEQVCAGGTEGYSLLTILRLLRNSVHGEAIQAAGYRTPQSYGTLVVLPRSESLEISTAMASLGGTDAWGVQDILNGRIHIDDPGKLVENILSRTLAMLNELMAKTPVEHLQHVALTSADLLPPSDQSSSAWSPSTMKSIRWQLGF